jgi:hypothetical protein
MSERTPEQTQTYASKNLDDFFGSVSPELKERVVSLPKRIAKMNARTVIKLHEVLDTADQIFSHAGNFAACARGCGHCCHVSVPITEFEAQYISDHIHIAAVKVKQTIKHDLGEFSSDTPCPFLVNSECSIYEARPLTCRMHMNFDVDNHWCLHENWKKPEAVIPRPTITPLIDAYHLLPGSNKPIVADIRDFFPNGKG